MTKARLLQAVCTVAMLAAAPAFAQTNTQPATTGADNSVNSPTGTGSSMAPADRMGSSDSSGMSTRSTHHATMGHSSGMMRSRGDSSQNAAVDQLNEQSYQAAQRGEAFNGSGSSGSSYMGSGNMGSGSMNSGSMNSGSMNSGSMGSGSMGSMGSNAGGSPTTGGMISPRSDPTGAVHANPSVDTPPGGGSR